MTFGYQLLGFSQNESIIQTIKEETLPAFEESFERLSHSDLIKLKKYISMYAKNNEINETSRDDYYSIIESIEKQIIQNSETRSSASGHDSVFSEVTENLKNAFTINEFTAREEERKEAEAIKNGIETRKIEADMFNEIRDLKDLLSDSECSSEIEIVNDGGRKGGLEGDANGADGRFLERQLAEEGLVLEKAEYGFESELVIDDPNSMGARIKKAVIDGVENELSQDEDEEDQYVDPLDGLSSKELRKRLPPYIFMSSKRKKKYFKTLSKHYGEKVVTRKISKPNDRRVNFVLENNKVTTFHKGDKIL